MKPIQELDIYEYNSVMNILTLSGMPEAIIIDLLINAEGLDAKAMSNKELLKKLEEYETLLTSIETLPTITGWQYEGYTLPNIEDCAFIKYYVHQKLYATESYKNTIQESLPQYNYIPLLPVITTWLDHESDTEYYNHEERQKRTAFFAQKPALFALNCYKDIITQLNELPTLYPDYFANSELRKKLSREEYYYIYNALDLQLEYMAKINHCKIEEVYTMPISLVLKHIALSNQKNRIEHEKNSRNIQAGVYR